MTTEPTKAQRLLRLIYANPGIPPSEVSRFFGDTNISGDLDWAINQVKFVRVENNLLHPNVPWMIPTTSEERAAITRILLKPKLDLSDLISEEVAQSILHTLAPRT